MSASVKAALDVHKNRLLQLIDYCRETVTLRSKPVSRVEDHRSLALYEHEVQGLPGIKVNIERDDDEIWLVVDRLRETKPPEITSALLKPWVNRSDDPSVEPVLRGYADGLLLIEAGTHRRVSDQSQTDKPTVDPLETVRLEDYDRASEVKALFTTYLNSKWRPWAQIEKPRRETIRIYSELFTLVQQLEGSIVESQLEVVWGVGVGVWDVGGIVVRYPTVSRLVEVRLNSDTAQIEVRPRDVEPRLELDWYSSQGNPGVAGVKQKAKALYSEITQTFSPFDHSTFEPILRTAASTLDKDGVYCPDAASGTDRKLPVLGPNLQVTDTWVLFARPRTNSLFLQDLERLREEVERAEGGFPPAVTSIVTEPDKENRAIELPRYRGVSVSYHGRSSAGSESAQELYFPKPFNDEQVRIIQLLEVHNGVVVQGPPGTGKTHTIANIICHYLAQGKRVLVTSMKDPALAVLQEQVPDDIRPLAVPLLTSEAEGMKQFEHAISKIAAEVQSLDRVAVQRDIKDLEKTIDTLHAQIAAVDYEISEWAERNLSSFELDGEGIDPLEAAREVIDGEDLAKVIPDRLGVEPEFRPQITDEDMTALRDARRALGKDIDYLEASIPQLGELPDPDVITQLHQDLAQYERLRRAVEAGEVPGLANYGPGMLQSAKELLSHIETIKALRSEIQHTGRSWTSYVYRLIREKASQDLLQLLEALGSEIEQLVGRHTAFLARPVEVPNGIEGDPELVRAIDNLAKGKSAFGVKGLLGKRDQKTRLASISVIGSPPANADDWKYVREYVGFLNRCRQLVFRWNAIAAGLGLPVMDERPGSVFVPAQEYALYRRVKSLVETEALVSSGAPKVLPTWVDASGAVYDEEKLSRLESILRHHVTQGQLSNVWSKREQCATVLADRCGRVVDRMRSFFRNTLGNPDVGIDALRSEWSSILTELRRVHALSEHLNTVQVVCERIEESGAPEYASLLRQPLDSVVDQLIPDDWRQAWRLRRLNTYLELVDAHEHLRQLASRRSDLQNELSRAYRDIVVKRTWLKLTENATPNIRSALQAYLNAIRKIGKGTGKRAVRYRRDARRAAAEANPAVPCWIMAHYRVSESLPPKLGCFDLVIIDEASQSDLTALPAILRAQKVLIVGDDKQVSPEGIGQEEEKIRALMARSLHDQVDTYRAQMSPDRSIYDLFKVVFASSSVMLKEHFRCVAPIIEYSKREFYNHELLPLRVPKPSERLDPPLVDVRVIDGYREGDVNKAEAQFIVDEITRITQDPRLQTRSIGVVSLLGHSQARLIWDKLVMSLGPEAIQRHRITCGDARTFQGKERDIMFLSMVVALNDMGTALTRDTYAQRFNVAASRARDRMYLVRSVGLERLSPADTLRRNLIDHFSTPFAQDESRVESLRELCESEFEREMYDELVQRGYRVIPQVRVGRYRIDLVVEGQNDTRLAIECDGDRYHGLEHWMQDMQRQVVLERAGWRFWRCFASSFVRRRKDVVNELIALLSERGIEPMGSEDLPRSFHTEYREVRAMADERTADYERSESSEQVAVTDEPTQTPDTAVPNNETSESVSSLLAGTPGRDHPSHEVGGSEIRSRDLTARVSSVDTLAGLPIADYAEYSGLPCLDPRAAGPSQVTEGLIRIIEVEGPVVAKRAYDVYLRSCGIKRMGRELRRMMDRALAQLVRRQLVVCEDELGTGDLLDSVVRAAGTPPVRLRRRGPRNLDEIPPSEVQLAARRLADIHGFSPGSDEHLRAILGCFDLVRLTTQAGARLLDILEREFSCVDELLRGLNE
ncbi:MAG: DUF559 domain-containing protein [Firmicutes bacterium]|nr:DUF559 domain-containing protein [Bacillota bacterium]